MNRNPHQAHKAFKEKLKDPVFHADLVKRMSKNGKQSALKRKKLKQENEEMKKQLHELKVEESPPLDD